jgi:hypothetical protein
MVPEGWLPLGGLEADIVRENGIQLDILTSPTLKS